MGWGGSCVRGCVLRSAGVPALSARLAACAIAQKDNSLGAVSCAVTLWGSLPVANCLAGQGGRRARLPGHGLLKESGNVTLSSSVPLASEIDNGSSVFSEVVPQSTRGGGDVADAQL